MAISVILYNKNLNEYKIVPVGFSFTTLFFGFLVPLYRKDYLMCLVILLSILLIPLISNLLFAYSYNSIYCKSILKKGYLPATTQDLNVINKIL